MGRLAGKRILVTGAGGKMGSQFVRAFAAEGADLVLTTRTAAKGEALAQALTEGGARAAAIAADLTRDAEIDALADNALAAFGGIDVVLLSSQPPEPCLGSLLETSDDDWRQQQMSILWGPFRLLKRLVPGMIASGGGSIIAITSSTGHEPVPDYGAYGLAKGGLWTLTLYMAAEWGRHGIRANAICPGGIATGGSGAARTDAPPPGLVARTSLGRLGRNGEVTGAAVYLASDESSFTSGQCIAVNGGRF